MARYPEITIGSADPFTYTLTYAASIAIDMSLGSVFKVVLTGNVTFAQPTNIKEGQRIRLSVTQDGTGNRTVGFNTTYWRNVGGEPAPDLFASHTTVYIAYAADDGTGLKLFYYVEAPILAPATQANLVSWFDPLVGLTVNSSLQVSRYVSRYGGHELLQSGGTAANLPIYSSNTNISANLPYGLTTVLASAQRLQEATTSSIGTLLAGSASFTIYSVYRRGTTATTVQVPWALNIPGGSSYVGISNQSTTLGFTRDNATYTTATNIANQNQHIIIFSYASAGTWTFWLDSVSIAGTSGSTVMASGGLFSIGSRMVSGVATNPCTGSVGDIIIYNAVHTSAQRNVVNNFLRAKYRL